MASNSTGSEFSLMRVMGYLRSRRRQLAVFMVCVGISTFLWMMIKLNSHYIRSIVIEVKLTEVPENRRAVSLQSSKVAVEIRAQGYQLLFNEITMLKHLDLALSKTLLKPGKEKGVYFISTESMIARISSQLPVSTEILSMRPDTLFFRIDDIFREKVPIRPEVSMTIIPPWYLSDTFILTPDSVWITGTKDKIKQVTSVSTRPFSLSQPQPAFRYKLNLINPFPDHLVLQTKEVQLEGKMEKFSTQTWTLPVHFNDTVKIAGYPDYESITVSCRIPESKVSQFDPKTLALHGKKVVQEDGGLFVYPELTAPGFVKGIKLTPSRISIYPEAP